MLYGDPLFMKRLFWCEWKRQLFILLWQLSFIYQLTYSDRKKAVNEINQSLFWLSFIRSHCRLLHTHRKHKIHSFTFSWSNSWLRNYLASKVLTLNKYHNIIIRKFITSRSSTFSNFIKSYAHFNICSEVI